MRPISRSEMQLRDYSPARIKKLEEAKRHKPLAKAADLEEMYSTLLARRGALLADVKENGVVITVEKSNSRGMVYRATVVNPAFTALRSTEIQIVQLAKILGDGERAPEQMSTEELLAATQHLVEN